MPEHENPGRLRLASGVVLTPCGLSVEHLDRLLGGELLTVAPRLPWAQLLRRTFGFDVLRCSDCGGRRRLLAAVTDKAEARAILMRLGLPADVPRAGGGRDPTIERDDIETRWAASVGDDDTASIAWAE